MISEFLHEMRNRAAAFSSAGIVALIVAGLVFLIWPQGALALICRLLGFALLVYGIILLLRYLRRQGNTPGTGSLVLSIILFILGIVITVSPFFLVRISGTLLAVFFLGYGLFSLVRQIRMDVPRTGRWFFCMAGAVFELIIGILLLAAPVTASSLVLRIIGVVFLYAAVSALSNRKQMENAGNAYDQGGQDLFRTFRDTVENYADKDINGKEIIEGTARDVTDDNDTGSR